MRTRSPSSGVVAAVERSPSPVVAAKSSRDMEAAFAIAELSAGVSVSTPSSDAGVDFMPASVSPDGAPASPASADGKNESEGGKTGTCENTDQKRQPAPKFSHIKSAVMPTTHSYVQKALKRKLEGRTTELSAAELLGQFELDHRAVEENELLKRAIEKERDNFLTIKRHRPNPVSEASSGRFVRTCQPTSRTADETVESKRREISNPVLGVDFQMTASRQAANISYGDRCRSGSMLSEKDIVNYGDREPAFLPRRADQLGLKQMSEDIDRLKTRHDFLQSGTALSESGCERTSFTGMSSLAVDRMLSVTSHPAVTLSYTSAPVVSSRLVGVSPIHKHERANGALLEGKSGAPFVQQRAVADHRSAASRRPPRTVVDGTDGAASSREVPMDSLGKLKAFYNFGLNDGASHYLFPQLMSTEARSSRKALPERVVSGASMFVPMAVVPGWHRTADTTASSSAPCSSSQSKVTAMKSGKILDSNTEMKVKKGDFGSLHVLRDYYRQLGSQKTRRRDQLCKSASPEFRQNESALLNHQPCVNRSSSAEELAVDLSLPKREHSNPSDDNVCSTSCGSGNNAENQTGQSSLRQYGPVLDKELFRPSKSCGSSPTPSPVINYCLKNDAPKSSLQKIDRLKQNVDEEDVPYRRRWTGSSLPASPYGAWADRLREVKKQTSLPSVSELPSATQLGKMCTVDLPHSLPDSRLPLKKRRLHDCQSTSPTASLGCDTAQSNEGKNGAENCTAESSSYSIAENKQDLSKDHLADVMSTVIKPDEDGDLPLHIAVAKGQVTVVDQLIDVMSQLNVSLDCYNYLKQSPLHIAVLTDQPEIVRKLLIGGASPNVVDRNGLNSIHLAAQQSSTECLHYLLEYSTHTTNINALTYDGLTALHLAVRRGYARAVQRLLRAGAQVDSPDGKNGRTALFYAVECNDVHIAAILLAHGADPCVSTYSGWSPVQAASTTRCSTDLLQLLENYSSLGTRFQVHCCASG